MTDYSALRAQTLRSGADEEAVTVNTRALIDKVLARYSGEWTVLRELLQNAADAAATSVTVRFETLPSPSVPLPLVQTPSNLLKHTIQHHTIRRLIVSNNGTPFNESDWSRLKRIAEGNPDETKIGAFGVGFYSTFADCEEPFVSSGQEAMAFFWKNNSLFTRRLKLPADKATGETTFVLDYRDTTSSVPPLLPLAQFLASSLSFVGLEKLDLWLDQWNLLSLVKKASPSYDVPIPHDIEPKTSEGFMKVVNISKEVAQIDGTWMSAVGWTPPKAAASQRGDRDNGPSLRKFFSRLAGSSNEDQDGVDREVERHEQANGLTATVTTAIFLNVITASIKTFTSPKFNEELERATKKPPPKTTKLAILTAPYIDNKELSNAEKFGNVFGTVLPTKSGRIFIGFPTHQTTGLGAHISAPSVIPTVERESIDLNARYVRTWNIEMIRAAGIVCRIAWSEEMTSLRDKIRRQAGGRTKIRMEEVSPFLSEAITTTQNFTFRESTPSSRTGEILEDAFWKAGKTASIEVVSSCGVLATHQVRIAPKNLSFLDRIPFLPDRLMLEAKTFVDKLVDFGLVTEVTVSDIKDALESSALSSAHVSEFLTWLTKQATNRQLDRSTVASLLSVAIANDEASDGSPALLILGQKQHFLNPSRTPVDLPVPPTVMPFKFTKSLSKQELESLGWQELQIVPWVQWLIEFAKDRSVLNEEQDITSSTAFSGLILPILSKQWDSLSQQSRNELVETLAKHTTIPTKAGMRKPSESYFPTVKLFDDLPTIKGLPNVKEKFLAALGVRKTVELGVVFDRLLASNSSKAGDVDAASRPQWSHVDLIHYLASVREDVPRQDIERLRNTPICPRVVNGLEDGGKEDRRYKVSELFEPRPELRDLGLPVLSWPGLYRSGSAEGRLLSALGLRTVPTVQELIGIMAKAGASNNLDLRDKALAYFLSHHHNHNYGVFDYSSVKTPFLPLENKPGKLAIPMECFSDPGAALLGFEILKRDWAAFGSRFGVKIHPPIQACIKLLAQQPPATHNEARSLFTYFATRLNEINPSNIPKLQELAFVPVFSDDKEKSQVAKAYISPRDCFLGESSAYGQIFHYVDFGSEANSFLLKCGSKPEPTKVEIAQILVKEPARISSTFKNAEKYLMLLRHMADSISDLKKHKELFKMMKQAPFLLASRELPPEPSKTVSTAGELDDLDDDDEEENQGIREFQLCSAQDAIIVDDYLNYSLFKANILAAPQEETLENFYLALGSPLLSSLVEDSPRIGLRTADQRPAKKLQKQILERSLLFLHDQPADSIRHDSKWLERNLDVQLVSSITLRRSLKGRNITHTEKRTAVVTDTNRQLTLWISGVKPDLYQVSQALVHQLLHRPKPHSALTLETLLKHELLELRARGFNVNRILRQKAAEARLAENKRQEEMEAERKRIEEQQKAWAASQKQMEIENMSKQPLPGEFPTAPEVNETTTQEKSMQVQENEESQRSRSLFSQFSRQFGLHSNRPLQSLLGRQNNGDQEGVRSQQGKGDTPPPYHSEGGQAEPKQKEIKSKITAPHQMQENLLSAIRKARPHNSSGVFSRGETNQVSETKSYCDERPAHDLVFVAEIKHGIQMFISPTDTGNSSQFLQQHTAGLTAFANLLKPVGDVFSLDPHIINIFYDAGGKTIAFNQAGSIFCNYLYFQQLHETALLAAGAASSSQQKKGNLESAPGYANALVYWWVIFCHELAHNLVADHSSDHSYYTEGFVAQYFPRIVEKLGQRRSESPSSGNSRRPQESLIDA
ncbi:hypothetical protein DV738_g3760, partial [Chaetothyriales sp. CBS 135597]